ncbi:hypothetical protein [Rodentibacter caecimuris]|uniref:Type II toxin-antitoxin system RelE/ParE family toxin n=1 Tax=Rodentibacter caecimuris TaxID=1796644 RepID=A0ABX3L0L6_9PAST|nr:hypothetical protein BKG89_01325 [Rodentibacter heylii]
MKLDYKVVWTEEAEQQLLFILYDSQSIEVSFRFHWEIKELTQKLSYVATAYNDGRFHIYTVKNGHSVKSIVRDDIVYISAFLAKGREFVI